MNAWNNPLLKIMGFYSPQTKVSNRVEEEKRGLINSLSLVVNNHEILFSLAGGS